MSKEQSEFISILDNKQLLLDEFEILKLTAISLYNK